MGFIGLKDWVSIIVPCYNGEKFVERFIKNLVEQTYSKIHLIFIDDGSTDNTRKLFMQSQCLLESRGIKWEYYYQENQGQAAAINTALPKVIGEYCSWLDIDDLLTEDHIEKEVKQLEKEKKSGIVVCRGIAIDEENPDNELYELSTKGPLRSLFENILFDYVSCVPGLYMVRSKSLFEALQEKSIYVSRVGQNFQLLLPVVYQFKESYIDEILFFYRVRKDSHFHSVIGERDWEERIFLVEDVKKNVLLQMHIPKIQLEILFKALKFKFLQLKINKMIEYSDITGQSKYASAVISECLLNFTSIAEKELWIWGITEKNSRLAKFIEVYGGVQVKGFIDSNPVKVEQGIYGKKVILPSNIDVHTVALFIPLAMHEEIAIWLKEKGFQSGNNYLYPEYEIECCLKKYENEIYILDK